MVQWKGFKKKKKAFEVKGLGNIAWSAFPFWSLQYAETWWAFGADLKETDLVDPVWLSMPTECYLWSFVCLFWYVCFMEDTHEYCANLLLCPAHFGNTGMKNESFLWLSRVLLGREEADLVFVSQRAELYPMRGHIWETDFWPGVKTRTF